jgi:hypothetical protein
MSAFTHLSKHAFQRISERVRLSSEEVVLMLDAKITVNTGRKPGFNRDHLLLYNDFFSNLRPLPPENIYTSEILEFPMDFNM